MNKTQQLEKLQKAKDLILQVSKDQTRNLVNMWSTIKEWFTNNQARNFEWECLNCGEIFDGAKVESFIKHEMDQKHYFWIKRRKNQDE